jgi:aspartate-semialdehyde dehydrogenase
MDILDNVVPFIPGEEDKLETEAQKIPGKVKQAMREYVSDAQKLECPSAPQNAITVMEEPDRPQPRLDRDTQKGYTVSVGRIRKDESGIFDIKFVALSHNSKAVCASQLCVIAINNV